MLTRILKWFFILFIILNTSIFAKPSISYKIGDRLYVLAKSGLNLRAKPSKSGRLLQPVSFGEIAIVREFTNKEFEVEGIKGYWVKVLTDDREGYLFDGFLSLYPPPVNQLPSSSIPTLKSYAEKFLTKDTKVSEVRDDSMVTTSTLILPLARLPEAYLIGICFVYNFDKYKIPLKSDKIKNTETEVEYNVIKSSSGEIKSVSVTETYTASGGTSKLQITDLGNVGVEIKTVFAEP